MSSFWTPDGEHRVPPSDDDPAAPQPGPTEMPAGAAGPDDIDPATAARMEAELQAAQAQLLSVPAGQIVANHVIGLFELAALHLRVEDPDLEQARLPIDAMGLIIENLGAQLPDAETLAAALHQIRMAYVEIHGQQHAADDDLGNDPDGD